MSRKRRMKRHNAVPRVEIERLEHFPLADWLTVAPWICLLCQNKAEIMGCWVPNAEASRLMGVPDHLQRYSWYFLCDNCYALPDRVDLVSAKILENHGVGEELIEGFMGK